jgi:hypothetical protein
MSGALCWHDAWQQRLFEAYIYRRPPVARERRGIPGTVASARNPRVKAFLWWLQDGRCVWCARRMPGYPECAQ